MNLFKRMIAFVMAYSFSEDQESPSMIPMADMLNHHSNNNAHLIFERNSLKMVSCKKIEKVDFCFDKCGLKPLLPWTIIRATLVFHKHNSAPVLNMCFHVFIYIFLINGNEKNYLEHFSIYVHFRFYSLVLNIPQTAFILLLCL